MTERDPLDVLLREWKSPESAPELDECMVIAYRTAFRTAEDEAPVWRRFWKARVSIPVPLLAAAVVIVALFFWFH
jgi:hypothetical protein